MAVEFWNLETGIKHIILVTLHALQTPDCRWGSDTTLLYTVPLGPGLALTTAGLLLTQLIPAVNFPSCLFLPSSYHKTPCFGIASLRVAKGQIPEIVRQQTWRQAQEKLTVVAKPRYLQIGKC